MDKGEMLAALSTFTYPPGHQRRVMTIEQLAAQRRRLLSKKQVLRASAAC